MGTTRSSRQGAAWPLFGLFLACSAHAPATAPALAASSAAPLAAPVVAAPPPRDDGKSSAGVEGGLAHSAALEELKIGPLLPMIDKRRSVRLLVPDARHWTRVRFFGIPSLLGLRYGKDHHAVIGVSIQHVDPEAPLSACSKAFEAWGAPFLDTFDVDVARDPGSSFPWRQEKAEIHTSFARTASLAVHDGFAVAYATYPAWKGACLVVGIAVPAREDEARARAVRDRFAAEVLPKVVVIAKEEPSGMD